MASVSLEHVSKRYGDIPAIEKLSLDIADGEFMVIVGPSGCGKTTVLRLIAGLVAPDDGSVLIDGRVVDDVPPGERDVAMVFEDFALYPHMAVRDNLAFPLRMRKTPAEAIRRRITEVAASMEIDPILGRKPAALATGEAQHTAIGHAVMREHPSVFLLDDALSHLDAHQRLEARAELSRLHRALGATLVAVTHDQAEALAMGTRVAVMNQGSLQQVGEPNKLYEQPANVFVAGFIGNPGMNLLESTLERDDAGVRLHQASGSWSIPATPRLDPVEDGSTVVVGFRPEHVRLVQATAADELGFEATCDLVEYLGHRLLVHLHAAGSEIVCSTGPDHRPTAGEVVSCSIPVGRLHFFDPASGRSLRSGAGLDQSA